MEYVFQLIKTLALNNLPAVISALALLVSVISFIWNRQHAKTLFRATQYPDLDFYFDINTTLDPKRKRNLYLGEMPLSKDFKYESPLPHNVTLEVNWDNYTKVEAVNLSAVLTLTHGFKRIRWKYGEIKKIVPFLKQGKENIYIEQLLVKLCPEHLMLKAQTDSLQYIGPWLEVSPGMKSLEFGLAVEFYWQTPIWKGKIIGKKFIWGLKLNVEKGAWILKPTSRLFPKSLFSWRPITI